MTDEDEVDKSGGDETNLSNSSASMKSTGAGYLTSGSTKRGNGNSKKGVKAARGFDYLTPATKKTFNYLRHAFTQVFIVKHFNAEQHIRIETDVWGYAVCGILSWLTLDNLGPWHPVAYYSQKMIPAKTWYQTHNDEFLAIVEAFKTWRHYLKTCKHEVVVLIEHNNLWQIIDTKSLSSPQVC